MKSFLIVLSAALASAEKILDVTDHSLLPDAMAEQAGRLLTNDVPFVRAAAEWALSLKVGNENMLDQAKWPMTSNPARFVKWRDIPLAQRVEMD